MSADGMEEGTDPQSTLERGTQSKEDERPHAYTWRGQGEKPLSARGELQGGARNRAYNARKVRANARATRGRETETAHKGGGRRLVSADAQREEGEDAITRHARGRHRKGGGR